MKTTILIAALVILTGFIFGNDIRKFMSGSNGDKTEKKEKGQKKKDSNSENNNSESNDANAVSKGVKVIEKWDLPDELKEVSGIAYIDENRFACVQDEDGVIFIFNTTSNEIEKRIQFAGAGDYEGIAVKGRTAFIIRADGLLFEVNMDTKTAKEHKTGLTVDDNVEGLCYDKINNRLLLAGKDADKDLPGYKGIYAFNLGNFSFQQAPVFKIDLSNEILQAESKKKKNKPLMPSAMGIHPVSSEIYLTDGPKSHLVILNKDGKPKTLYTLGNDFSQPEGITFSPGGELYISNEGKKGAGNIIKVELR